MLHNRHHCVQCFLAPQAAKAPNWEKLPIPPSRSRRPPPRHFWLLGVLGTPCGGLQLLLPELSREGEGGAGGGGGGEDAQGSGSSPGPWRKKRPRANMWQKCTKVWTSRPWPRARGDEGGGPTLRLLGPQERERSVTPPPHGAQACRQAAVTRQATRPRLEKVRGRHRQPSPCRAPSSRLRLGLRRASLFLGVAAAPLNPAQDTTGRESQ